MTCSRGPTEDRYEIALAIHHLVRLQHHQGQSAAEQAVQAAIKEYQSMGAIVKEISLPNTDLAVPCYYIVAPSEASANLSRFDGVRYGYRCEDPKDLFDLYCRTREEGFGDEVKRRMIGHAEADFLAHAHRRDVVLALLNQHCAGGADSPARAMAEKRQAVDRLTPAVDSLVDVHAGVEGGFPQIGPLGNVDFLVLVDELDRGHVTDP